MSQYVEHAAALLGLSLDAIAMQANEREIAEGCAAAACRARLPGAVTILWGANDRILDPSHGIAVQRALPGSRLRLLQAPDMPYTASAPQRSPGR